MWKRTKLYFSNKSLAPHKLIMYRKGNMNTGNDGNDDVTQTLSKHLLNTWALIT